MDERQGNASDSSPFTSARDGGLPGARDPRCTTALQSSPALEDDRDKAEREHHDFWPQQRQVV